jgi:hypothetical protein
MNRRRSDQDDLVSHHGAATALLMADYVNAHVGAGKGDTDGPSILVSTELATGFCGVGDRSELRGETGDVHVEMQAQVDCWDTPQLSEQKPLVDLITVQ